MEIYGELDINEPINIKTLGKWLSAYDHYLTLTVARLTQQMEGKDSELFEEEKLTKGDLSFLIKGLEKLSYSAPVPFTGMALELLRIIEEAYEGD